jgi:hypothetical protein
LECIEAGEEQIIDEKFFWGKVHEVMRKGETERMRAMKLLME